MYYIYRDPRFVEGAGGISAYEADKFVQNERADMLQSARGARVVVCNLFCLEGVHIAEAIGAASVILSPCLTPAKGMPAGFAAEFASAMPTLYRRLIGEQQQQRQRQLGDPWRDPYVLLDTHARCSWDDVAC